MVRFKCSCGNVMNTEFGACCSKCKQPLNIPEDGIIYLYRKGSPLGIAGGFGIYIDEQPYGYIGNKESLHIPVKYGTHRLHIACGMNRGCNDLLIEITPQNRVFFTKVWMKPGFWTNSFVLEVAQKDEMPSTMYMEKYAPTDNNRTADTTYEQPAQQYQPPVQPIEPVQPVQPVEPVQQIQPIEPVQTEESRVRMHFRMAGDLDVPDFRVTCPNCGCSFTPDTRFCQECGTKLN